MEYRPGHSRKFTADQAKEIARLYYDQGLSQTKIAQKLGTSTHAVWLLLSRRTYRELDLPAYKPRPNVRATTTIEVALEMLKLKNDKGWQPKNIAKKYGVHINYVYKVIRGDVHFRAYLKYWD